MITKQTWAQLVAFALISVVGVVYTGVRYAGLGDYFIDTGYVIGADFSESGGIFENAEVTYRGVPVGEVERLELIDDGVRVYMRIEPDTLIPQPTRAIVANRSAIGEQYVDLLPQSEGEPYLDEGDIIPNSRTETPITPAELISNLDALAASIDTRDLAVVLDELGEAFDGAGDSLQRLVDSGNVLTQAALENIEPTRQLIRDSAVALNTQRDVSGQFRSFNRDLALLAEQLRASDPDFRRLFENGQAASEQVTALVQDNLEALPQLFDNLITLAQIQNVRLPALRQLFVTYPNVVAGGFTVTPGDGTAHFGLVTETEPPVCVEGYETTVRRSPEDTTVDANLDAYCIHGIPSEINVRGSRNVPRPLNLPPFPQDRQPEWSGPTLEEQPQSPSPGAGPVEGRAGVSFGEKALADYDPISGRVITYDGQRFTLGTTYGARDRFGTDSWRWLLLEPIAP